ncbi:hypothetical protein KIH27_18275 [Mycobacterium sp. M1]|uniref:Hydrogenase n=1 Tax=Mycolicibacter acidiphilus TaxID=2835306 RepID=A0ABS5RPV5_9MYCO|nr:hypothetical protein [Mycolicibacter acidiphilus]MBS9535536.1 hypothetical protein [Mycolicibacter acidiphilus]
MADYVTLLDLAAGGVLLTAVLIVWRRDLPSIVRLLRMQGVALAAIPVLGGWREGDAELIWIGLTVLVVRAVLLPWLLARAVGAERQDQREATPLVNTTASLLIATTLVVAAFAVAQPVTALQPTPASAAAPAALAAILIAMFVMATRRHAISQAAGFLMLDNGITAVAFLLTAGVPPVVELGVSLDVLFALIVLGVLTGRLRRMFGGADLDQLQELRD